MHENRGVVVLVFDSRDGCDFKAVSRILAERGIPATFFVSGQITRERAVQLLGLQSDGHVLGLSGLKGLDPKVEMEMYGGQKYYQDEVVTQLLDAKRHGLRIRYFAYPIGKGTADSDRLLLSKGFSRLVRASRDATPAVTDKSALSAVVVTTKLTAKNFSPAQIVDISSQNKILVVSPTADVLPALLEKAAFRNVPFATLDDLN